MNHSKRNEPKLKRSPENDGWIRMIKPEIAHPTLKDNTADVDRLLKGIKKVLHAEDVTINLSLAKGIPSSLRDCGYDVKAVLYKGTHSWHLVDLLPLQNDPIIHGLAVDLGSSRVVVRLLDLVTREVKDETFFDNPQNEIGPDILTRIHFASQEGGLAKLQTLLMERLNEEIFQLTEKHAILTESIVGMSVAGNTTMSHLFLGLDPFWICREPYIPAINRPDLLRSADLGLSINPEAPVMVFPNVGSYFGGDLIAGILASGMTDHDEISILIDVGTNAEVVLGNTSLTGASLALLSSDDREEVYKIRDRITYIELNVNQEFMNLFSAARFIPHTDQSLFPSVKERGQP